MNVIFVKLVFTSIIQPAFFNALLVCFPIKQTDCVKNVQKNAYSVGPIQSAINAKLD